MPFLKKIPILMKLFCIFGVYISEGHDPPVYNSGEICYNELEENFDELERVHKLWGEEIDRLRKVVTELQTNRFTTDEFISMLVKNFMPSSDKLNF